MSLGELENTENSWEKLSIVDDKATSNAKGRKLKQRERNMMEWNADKTCESSQRICKEKMCGNRWEAKKIQEVGTVVRVTAALMFGQAAIRNV